MRHRRDHDHGTSLPPTRRSSRPRSRRGPTDDPAAASGVSQNHQRRSAGAHRPQGRRARLRRGRRDTLALPRGTSDDVEEIMRFVPHARGVLQLVSVPILTGPPPDPGVRRAADRRASSWTTAWRAQFRGVTGQRDRVRGRWPRARVLARARALSVLDQALGATRPIADSVRRRRIRLVRSRRAMHPAVPAARSP